MNDFISLENVESVPALQGDTRLAIKAVSFDLDGTLIDTAGDIALAANAMLADFGMTTVPEDAIRNFIGKGVQAWVPRLLALVWGAPQPYLVPEALNLFDHHYEQLLANKSRIYPGVEECLVELRGMGLKLACITNKDARFTRPILERMGLSGYFDVMLAGDMLPHKKPDPLPLRHAAALMQVDNRQMLMIGDSENDVLAAKRADSPVFCVSYGYTEGMNVADFDADSILDDMRGMLPLIRKS